MKKFFGVKKDNSIILDGEEITHLAVLRCNIGDNVVCFTGDKFEYLCKIEHMSKRTAVCEIIEKRVCLANPSVNITLFQGLPKQDKLELICQKLTELGILNVIPFESSFTVAKPNQNKFDRINKIIIEACKQCGRSIPLQLKQTIKFNEMLGMLTEYDLVLFANETNKTINSIKFEGYDNIAIIVGSEGGFSVEEIKALSSLKNVTQIGLGQRILRTETASIVVCGLVSYLSKN